MSGFQSMKNEESLPFFGLCIFKEENNVEMEKKWKLDDDEGLTFWI